MVEGWGVPTGRVRTGPPRRRIMLAVEDRTVISGVKYDGPRPCLTLVAEIGGRLLHAMGEDAGLVTETIGGIFLAPHLDARRIDRSFGVKRGFPHVGSVVQLAHFGVLGGVIDADTLHQALQYGNHNSMLIEISNDVRLGRAIVFPKGLAPQIHGLRMSPLAVVHEGTKARNIHNLTFSGG
ncbi:unnamed protein product [Discosporangium mesarthrocarpum]